MRMNIYAQDGFCEFEGINIVEMCIRDSYQTVEDDDNVGVLFPVGMLKLIHSGTAVKTKKYQI